MFWISTLAITLHVGIWFMLRIHPGRRHELITPFAVLQGCFFIYCGIGPLYNYSVGNIFVIGIDLFENASDAALAALLAYAFANVGHAITYKNSRSKYRPPFDKTAPVTVGILTYGIFYLGLLVSVIFEARALYNVMGLGDAITEGAALQGFQTYLYLMMSSLIGPTLLCISAGTTYGLAVGGLFSLNAAAIFVSTGFRIRLALLFLSATILMAARNMFGSERKFPLIRIIQLGLIALTVISAMSISRRYGYGVDREIIKQASVDDFVGGFFKDTSIYFVGGKVVAMYSENPDRKHTYFETVGATVIRAIPSAIYGTKPTPQTLQAVQDSMGGTAVVVQSGFAVPYYIEHFIMFGWFGLVSGSLLVGLLCAYISNKLSGDINISGLTIYALICSYVFMYFHRGYLPQQVDYFMFYVAAPYFALLPFRNYVR